MPAERAHHKGINAMTRLTRAVAAASIALAPLTADAAGLDLASFGYAIEGTVASAAGGDVTVTESVFFPGVYELFSNDAGFELTLDSFDTADPAQAAFTVFGPDPAVDELASTVATAQAASAGIAEFLFEGVLGEGGYLPFDGGAVLVTLTAPGLTLDGSFTSFGAATLTVESLVAAGVIPLPAGMLLLLTALGAMGIARRARP